MIGHELFHYHSLDQVRSDIARTGVDLELDNDVSNLLEPVQCGRLRLPNRLVVLPMEGCDGTAEGDPGELTIRRYKRFAAGGSGLLWFEATAVVEEGRANPRQLWIRESNVAQYASLLEESLKSAREACGAGFRPVSVLQLTHSGRYSKPGRAPRPIIAHHSKFLDPIHKLGPDYPLITDDELERLEDAYVAAAQAAYKAGFDAVDVKACHRYLMSELHASFTRENSRYGGPEFENRSRLFRNIVRKIRDRVPGIIVTSRMNAYDSMAYPYGFGVDRDDPAKPDLREPLELLRFLQKEGGAPLANITIGNPYFNPFVNRPFDLPIVGAPFPPEHPLIGMQRFVHVVRELQQAMPEMPLIGGGYTWLRHYFPHLGAANVRKGWVTLVGAGRMAFAYPDYPLDLAKGQGLDPERACVACSACTQIMRDGGRSGCVPRDAAIYEPIYKTGRANAIDEIANMAKTCRQCNDPNCVSHCPARVNVPQFINQIASGDYRAAYETLRETNVLTTVCGFVCPSETLCESKCINQYYTQTVPIRHLQRWVSAKAVDEGWVAEKRTASGATGKRVAVVGAGPAGIAGAVTLASFGHEVTLLERAETKGGIAGATIPSERLPDAVLHKEIEDVLASSGNIERRRGVSLSAGFTLDTLFGEGYDAVLLAAGLSDSIPLDAGARPAAGVQGAIEFLKATKQGAKVEGTVLVIGGGNTAIDAALSAKRAGASDVSIVYRRSFAEMPAWPEERDSAIRAGVNFLVLSAPLGYDIDAEGKLVGLKVARTRLGAPDASGRRRPENIPGTEHTLPADIVVEAIGQRIDEGLKAGLPGVAFTRGGAVQVQPGTMATSRKAVYAAGDIINGGATVVAAVADGVKAAREIHASLTA